MFTKEFLGVVAVVLSLAGYVPYIWSICKGQTRPHLFSWLLWGVLNGILCYGQRLENAGTGAWVTGSCAIVSLLVAILAVRYGEKSIGRSDWLTLAAAMAALPFWFVTKDPLWSIIGISAIDTLAWLPTFRKTYAKPLEENAAAFALFALAWLCGLFSLQAYDLGSVLPTACGIAEESAFLLVILWRRNVLWQQMASVRGIIA